MTRPILVFGAGGRVGGELRELAEGRCSVFAPSMEEVDIRNGGDVFAAVRHAHPHAIVNLAACTLPYAETPEGREEAMAINAYGVQNIRDAARETPVIHLSTDCVFDGRKLAPYVPADVVRPVNFYGESKRVGEGPLKSLGAPHIILRTTGVYLRNKPNFLETVLKAAQEGRAIDVVSDSLYSPTDARELARAILTATERVIEDPSVSGTYHFAGPDVMSYLDFARLVQEEAGVTGEIKPVTMADREKVEGFKRPKNAALNSDKFAEVFGLRHRSTRDCVRELVNPAR